jgi:hypothetical protein
MAVPSGSQGKIKDKSRREESHWLPLVASIACERDLERHHKDGCVRPTLERSPKRIDMMSCSDRTKLTMVTLLGCVLSICALSACGGGGTSGTVAVTPSTTTAATTTTVDPGSVVSAPEGASLHGNSLPVASGTTPNFTTSLPANGTTFPLDDAVLKIATSNGQTPTTVTGYTNSLTGGATLTLQGQTTHSYGTRNVFELKIPALSLDASNIESGSYNILSDGRELRLTTSALNYSLLGAWSVMTKKTGSNQPDTIYWGVGFTGYQTPTSGIPTSGSATYTAGPAGHVDEGLSAGGGVAGLAIFGGKFANIGFVDLTGQASVDVNFGTGKVNGSLFNMTSYDSGPALDPVPWNNVALSGNLSGATMQGTTSVTSVPAGFAPFSSSATGTFTGALFGPNAQELGLSWTLYDPSGNRSAIGVVSATTP